MGQHNHVGLTRSGHKSHIGKVGCFLLSDIMVDFYWKLSEKARKELEIRDGQIFRCGLRIALSTHLVFERNLKSTLGQPAQGTCFFVTTSLATEVALFKFGETRCIICLILVGHRSEPDDGLTWITTSLSHFFSLKKRTHSSSYGRKRRRSTRDPSGLGVPCSILLLKMG